MNNRVAPRGTEKDRLQPTKPHTDPLPSLVPEGKKNQPQTCLKKLLLPQANQESVRAGFYLDPMSYYLDDLGEVILTSLGLSGCLSKTRKGYVQFTALLEGLHEAAH